MTRRLALFALLATLAVIAAPVARAEQRPADALLVGDSIAYQLGPRLGKAMHARGLRLEVSARGGSSARQWLVKGWMRAAIESKSAELVFVSLGVNCTSSERKALPRDVEGLVALAHGRRVVWLLPSSTGYRFPVDYARDAVDANGLELFEWTGKRPGDRHEGLPLEVDRVHLTDAGNVKLAGALVATFWPREK